MGNGAPFDKIIYERERSKKLQQLEALNNQRGECKEVEVAPKQEFEDCEKHNNPWSNSNVVFGRWYKSKLKADLSKLIDLMCMFQDVIAMKNINDAAVMCMELREANKRLLTITLRAEDPPAIDCLMQLVTINSALLDCYQKLKNGKKIHNSGRIETIFASLNKVFISLHLSQFS